MGNIIESRRRHYVGDDADKNSIPAVGKDFGDSYHANDKGKQYYWNGAAWKTGLGYEYVPRLTGAIDVTQAILNTNGAWQVNGLDLSAIVPAEAVAVHLRIILQDDAAGSPFAVRRDAVNTWNSIEGFTQVANISVEGNAIVAIDSDRLLDYNGAPADFVAIQITVMGWFI